MHAGRGAWPAGGRLSMPAPALGQVPSICATCPCPQYPNRHSETGSPLYLAMVQLLQAECDGRIACEKKAGGVACAGPDRPADNV